MEVKPGYKHTEVGVIPEEWEVDTLASVTPRNARNGIVDGPFGSNLKTIHYRNAGIPIVTSGYVTDGRFFADTYLYVEKQKFEEEKRSAVRPGDIVMAKIGARCGASAILPPGHPIGILSGNALKITVDETRHATFYIWQVLWSLYSEGNVEALRTVGAQPAISMANLKKHKIALPPRPEQRAIAGALSDVDTLIGALDQNIAKKRDIKQAAMQQLLTGQKRLPGFRGEWETKAIGDQIDLLTGFPFPSDKYSESGVRLLRGSNVKRGETDWADDLVQYWPSITPEIERYQMQSGDLVIAMDGSLVGRSYARLKPNDLPAVLLQRVARIRSKTIEMGFLTQVVGSERFIKYCDSVKTVTAIPHISSADIRSFETPLPPTIAEQTAIAEVLSDMDAELAALEQRRDKTCALKQGMMQELLTGRIRLIN